MSLDRDLRFKKFIQKIHTQPLPDKLFIVAAGKLKTSLVEALVHHLLDEFSRVDTAARNSGDKPASEVAVTGTQIKEQEIRDEANANGEARAVEEAEADQLQKGGLVDTSADEKQPTTNELRNWREFLRLGGSILRYAAWRLRLQHLAGHCNLIHADILVVLEVQMNARPAADKKITFTHVLGMVWLLKQNLPAASNNVANLECIGRHLFDNLIRRGREYHVPFSDVRELLPQRDRIEATIDDPEYGLSELNNYKNHSIAYITLMALIEQICGQKSINAALTTTAGPVSSTIRGGAGTSTRPTRRAAQGNKSDRAAPLERTDPTYVHLQALAVLVKRGDGEYSDTDAEILERLDHWLFQIDPDPEKTLRDSHLPFLLCEYAATYSDALLTRLQHIRQLDPNCYHSDAEEAAPAAAGRTVTDNTVNIGPTPNAPVEDESGLGRHIFEVLRAYEKAQGDGKWYIAPLPEKKLRKSAEDGETIMIRLGKKWKDAKVKDVVPVQVQTGERPAYSITVVNKMNEEELVIGITAIHAPAPQRILESGILFANLLSTAKTMNERFSGRFALVGDFNTTRDVLRDGCYSEFFSHFDPAVKKHMNIKTSVKMPPKRGGTAESEGDLWSEPYDKILIFNKPVRNGQALRSSIGEDSPQREPEQVDCSAGLDAAVTQAVRVSGKSDVSRDEVAETDDGFQKALHWKRRKDVRRYSDHAYVYRDLVFEMGSSQEQPRESEGISIEGDAGNGNETSNITVADTNSSGTKRRKPEPTSGHGVPNSDFVEGDGSSTKRTKNTRKARVTGNSEIATEEAGTDDEANSASPTSRSGGPVEAVPNQSQAVGPMAE